MRIPRLHVVAMLGATLSVQVAQGAEPEPSDTLPGYDMLGEVVVTGTRTPKLLKETPVHTRLISARDIERSDATDLMGLLQAELPGVEFSYAMNQQVNMNLSGFSGQSVLILVDGERLAGETMDNVDFSRLLTRGVERVEIIKGAASALYGSSASGGVINIITKRATRPWSLNAESRIAGHREWRAGVSVGTASRKWTNMLDATLTSTEAFNVCLDYADECDFRRVPGMRTANFADRVSFSPIDNLRLTARAGYYFKQRDYNPDMPDRYRDFTAGLRGEWRLSPESSLEISYAFDQYDKSDFIKTSGLDIRDYRNARQTVRSLFTQRLASVALSAGADFLYDYLDTYQFTAGESKRETSADIFAQGDWTINNHWEIVGAIRGDRYFSRGEGRLTSKLNLRYLVGHLAIRTGYASGFRAPSLKERYMNFDMAGIFDIYGNPSLKSEQSHNINISADYSEGRYNLSASFGYSIVDNKITTSAISHTADGDPFIRYINVPRLNVASFELTVQARWSNGFDARIAYAFTHEDASEAGATQYCPPRPHAINVRAGWSHGWNADYSTAIILSGRFLSKVSYKSMRLYEPFEEIAVTNPAYTLWKMQIALTWREMLTLSLAVDNIFNYIPRIYSYNAPVTTGANLMVGLSITL